MKFLIRKDKENKKLIDFQTVQEEYIHSYQDIEELPYKDGFYVTYEWDNEEQKVVGKYVEAPKSQQQLIEEERSKLMDEINTLKQLIIPKKDEKDLDLSELDNINNIDLNSVDMDEEVTEMDDNEDTKYE